MSSSELRAFCLRWGASIAHVVHRVGWRAVAEEEGPRDVITPPLTPREPV